MKSLKVSILVPVYGVEQYIEKCAVSLFGQSYKDMEFIFVDDCSQDNSVSVLESVLARFPTRQSQTKILHHQQNRGLGAARKTALNMATGEFVLNVDSDDFLSPDAVSRLVERQMESNADIVTGLIRIYDAHGNSRDLVFPESCKSDVVKLLLIQNTIPHNLCARLVRRSLFYSNNISPVEGINQAEDYAVTPRLFFCAERLAVEPNAIYHYLVFTEGAFSDKISSRHVISYLKANEAISSFFIERDKLCEYSFALETGMLNAYRLAMKAGLSRTQIKQVCYYTPQRLLFRLCHGLFAHPLTLPLLRISYLSIKWCYKRKLHYHG